MACYRVRLRKVCRWLLPLPPPIPTFTILAAPLNYPCYSSTPVTSTIITCHSSFSTLSRSAHTSPHSPLSPLSFPHSQTHAHYLTNYHPDHCLLHHVHDPCPFLPDLGNIRVAPVIHCYQANRSYTLAAVKVELRKPAVLAYRPQSSKMSTLAEEKQKFSPPDDLGTKYTTEEVHRYMVDCMTSVGTPRHHAQSLADVLLAADTRGHYSHGLNRLEMYVNDVRQGVCAGGAVPTITKESVSTALVHGNNGLGPVVGNFCVDLAVKKAKETGIGWVCARGSNHYAIAGWYAMRATKEGMLGMSFTNTSPLVAPTRAKKAALGTNPIAVSAPAKNGDDFVLDMATCVVAVGKMEVEKRKEKPIPEGWAIDKDGQPTTNAAEGMAGALMPLGGPELHSGYKGYGLGMLVEIFCGIMSGGQYGPNVRRWMQTDREADLGQCFVAIDPTFFAPGFEDRMTDLMGHCRSMDPAEEGKPVLAAGDPERAHIDQVKSEGGITYHINQIKDSWKLAKALGVKPME